MTADQNHFQLPLSVRPEDIDELGHVNNVVYVRWIQEVAAAHWEHAASPLLKDKYRWVVLRHEIDYHNAAFLNDQIIGYTWVGSHYGARFDRFVKLCLQNNDKIIAESKTTWCMLDNKTLRPTRIQDDVLAIL